MSFSFYKAKSKRGFTLIELLVSISIMLVITSAVLMNQSNYTDEVALKNLANDISLSLREAQVYGTGVKELSLGSGDFSAAYGLMFQTVGLDDRYYFFADRGDVKNRTYDGPAACPTDAASECLKLISIPNGNKIEQICVLINPHLSTNLNFGCGAMGRVDISFSRPDTKAHFVFWDQNITSPWVIPETIYIGARIKIISPVGARRTIDVYTSGQISVQ